jgi:putative membrane protein
MSGRGDGGAPRPRIIPDGAPVPEAPPRHAPAPAPPEATARPRILREEGAPAARLDLGWDRAVAPVSIPGGRGWSSAALVAAGAALLILGFSALEAGNFVAAQFARAAWLGWVTLAVAAGGFGLVGAAIWRELRGILALRSVDRARAAAARRDAAALRAEIAAWQARLPPGRTRITELDAPPEALRAMVEAATLAPIAQDAAALGRAAALQAFAVTAISPSPAADALIFAWRGLRLVRQVAALHGMRPGIAGTIALLRRVAVDAAMVAATDVAVDAAVRGLLSSKIAEHVAGEAAAGAVAARRMILLARATDEACRILPRG